MQVVQPKTVGATKPIERYRCVMCEQLWHNKMVKVIKDLIYTALNLVRDVEESNQTKTRLIPIQGAWCV